MVENFFVGFFNSIFFLLFPEATSSLVMVLAIHNHILYLYLYLNNKRDFMCYEKYIC